MAKKKKGGNEPVRRAIALGATAMTVAGDAMDDPVVIARGFSMTVNGLDVAGAPTLQLCEKVGVILRVQERGAQFAIGDFILYVEEKFGEDAAQVIDNESGWSEKTIGVYRWMAQRISKSRRRMDRLGVRHHLLVASLAAGKQKEWLDKAANDGGDPWTIKQLAEALDESGEAVDEAWWVLVAATSALDQSILVNNLTEQGRTAKALMRRGKKKKDGESS